MYYCDNCDREVDPSGEWASEYPEAPFATESTNIGESAVVCYRCECALLGYSPKRWNPDCQTCQDWGQDHHGPSHEAMSNCKSGKRNHCTCDGCF